MGVGAVVEATGVALLLSGVHDVGPLLHRATVADGGVAAGEGTARMLLVVLGSAATLVWLALAGAVAAGSGWARWLASAYAVAYLAVTGLALPVVGGRTAWLGLLEAAVAAAVLLVLWVPLRPPRR